MEQQLTDTSHAGWLASLKKYNAKLVRVYIGSALMEEYWRLEDGRWISYWDVRGDGHWTGELVIIHDTGTGDDWVVSARKIKTGRV